MQKSSSFFLSSSFHLREEFIYIAAFDDDDDDELPNTANGHILRRLNFIEKKYRFLESIKSIKIEIVAILKNNNKL